LILYPGECHQHQVDQLIALFIIFEVTLINFQNLNINKSLLLIWDLLYLENEILAHFKIYLDLKES